MKKLSIFEELNNNALRMIKGGTETTTTTDPNTGDDNTNNDDNTDDDVTYTSNISKVHHDTALAVIRKIG